MSLPMNENYYLSNASGSRIFNPDVDLYEGVDGNIYIASCESDVYGTPKAAEGYDEEKVGSFSEVQAYFKSFDSISRRTDQHDYKEVNREDFFVLLQDRFEELMLGYDR